MIYFVYFENCLILILASKGAKNSQVFFPLFFYLNLNLSVPLEFLYVNNNVTDDGQQTSLYKKKNLVDEKWL